MGKKSLIDLWKSYRHRFVPWMATNIKASSKREVAAAADKIATDERLKDIIIQLSLSLHKEIKSAPTANGEAVMLNTLGYSVQRCKSYIQDAGTGVVVTAGSAQRGDFIAFYPGTLYRRFEPLFLPSIGNHFIIRCVDGIHVDGNDRFLSKTIFRSCVNRDSFGHYHAADISWMSHNPSVPWNVGQYVNNGSDQYPANVAYQELDLRDFPPELDYLLPNIWFSGSRGRHLRTVVLVATRDIHKGDEIYSNYVTLVHGS
ncbi:SET domain-containing protein 9 [Frankliniella fusca]|uniref:SET domain-containing protein 9 n=1 Tax=Frankliniella fusca TaxID=407009 RepID=A0AAE1GVS8_9NEOP|nr:SET domain-containing protein 9 [Frankliniella fusca]